MIWKNISIFKLCILNESLKCIWLWKSWFLALKWYWVSYFFNLKIEPVQIIKFRIIYTKFLMQKNSKSELKKFKRLIISMKSVTADDHYLTILWFHAINPIMRLSSWVQSAVLKMVAPKCFSLYKAQAIFDIKELFKWILYDELSKVKKRLQEFMIWRTF